MIYLGKKGDPKMAEDFTRQTYAGYQSPLDSTNQYQVTQMAAALGITSANLLTIIHEYNKKNKNKNQCIPMISDPNDILMIVDIQYKNDKGGFKLSDCNEEQRKRIETLEQMKVIHRKTNEKEEILLSLTVIGVTLIKAKNDLRFEAVKNSIRKQIMEKLQSLLPDEFISDENLQDILMVTEKKFKEIMKALDYPYATNQGIRNNEVQLITSRGGYRLMPKERKIYPGTMSVKDAILLYMLDNRIHEANTAIDSSTIAYLFNLQENEFSNGMYTKPNVRQYITSMLDSVTRKNKYYLSEAGIEYAKRLQENQNTFDTSNKQQDDDDDENIPRSSLKGWGFI